MNKLNKLFVALMMLCLAVESCNIYNELYPDQGFLCKN